ncbi:hypothetical protein DPMN_194027 [Dreissena polymorpha]|uniref:Uncharacterized protein n=1 Tax=Dreissena polymorpha TaxID=45954 RepID=A0A9D4BDR0_DREPO|nr:hypothetical protein DPMN_194027 [Dreissena polymorpha]
MFGTGTRHETAKWHFKRKDAGKTKNVVIFRFDRECNPPPSFAEWAKFPTGTSSPYP